MKTGKKKYNIQNIRDRDKWNFIEEAFPFEVPAYKYLIFQ